MEDSYTVHRRRKASARRREKTPEPSSRSQQLVETSDDEEQARRARMVQMAEDAERSELHERDRRERNQEEDSQPKVQDERKKKRSPVKVDEMRCSPHKDSRATRDEGDARQSTAARSVKKESLDKVDSVSPTKSGEAVTMHQDATPRSKDVDGDTDRPVEPRKVERRLKKKSRERIERHGQSSDSSDAAEIEKHPRRTKSPEAGKARVKKSSSKRAGSNVEVGKANEATEKPRDRSSQQKLEAGDLDAVKPSERRRSRVHSQTDDTNDEGSNARQTEAIERTKRSPSNTVKKQIILLNDDSLIEDFARAQEEYLKREKSILDPDTTDVFEDAEEETTLRRRRKFSVPLTENEQEAIERSIERLKQSESRNGWFSWLPFFDKKKQDGNEAGEQEAKKDEQQQREVIEPPKQEENETTEAEATASKPLLQVRRSYQPGKVSFIDFLTTMRDVAQEFKAFVAQNPKEAEIVRGLRNRCMSGLMLVMIYCGLGAFIFRFTEGAFETFYKCGVKRVKRDFLDSLWNYSHNLREDDWKSMARRKLMEFEEQLHNAHEAGVHTYSGQRSWSFLNAVVYCLTVITTIGYGHISPSTNTGRAITIVYAIFGIPMFLIILADFGKLFTRGIKFLWAFVRRVYYTGSCRKVRRTVPVQEVMKGVQLVYDLATFKRPSQINPEDIEEMQKQAQQPQTVLNLDGNVPDTPATPAMSAFAIDDEFNLPISVAIFILLGYIFIGATLFCLSEGWGFFESFYFVFISMSTIGFGDYVPKHPIYMMCSIIYLVFGLALTSMCINVVQVMLSDSFKQASQKIGATIGFEIAEEDRSVKAAVPPSVEVADVHTTVKESNSEEKIAPKARQEDVDL